MKRPLQTGDRVRVYYSWNRVFTTTVKEIKSDSIITVQAYEVPLEDLYVNPKQCRRLVKKKRRSVWVDPASFKDTHENVYARHNRRFSTDIEFREVKKGP